MDRAVSVAIPAALRGAQVFVLDRTTEDAGIMSTVSIQKAWTATLQLGREWIRASGNRFLKLRISDGAGVVKNLRLLTRTEAGGVLGYC